MSSLWDLLLVGTGGFVGASLRFLVSGLVQRLDPIGTFPYGTLSVNVITAKILRLSSDLPIVIEIVDTMDKIEAFLPEIDEAIGHGLATIEKVEVRFYRDGEE